MVDTGLYSSQHVKQFSDIGNLTRKFVPSEYLDRPVNTEHRDGLKQQMKMKRLEKDQEIINKFKEEVRENQR